MASGAITWLPLKQSSPIADRSKLVAEIMAFLDPFRRKVFGNPPVVITRAYFVRIPGGRVRLEGLLTSTSTNVDGTRACVLVPGSLHALQQRIESSHQFEVFASSSLMVPDGMRSALTAGRLIGGSMANTDCRGTVDFVHRVVGNTVMMRVIAGMSDGASNGAPGAAKASSTDPDGSISIVFQTALDAQVPTGGALAVWAPAYNGSEGHSNCYLMLICPSIQGGARVPTPGGLGPQGAQNP